MKSRETFWLLSVVVTVLAIYIIVRALLIAAVWMAALVIALAVLVIAGLGYVLVLLASSRRTGARSTARERTLLITSEKLRAMDYSRLSDLEQNGSRLKAAGGLKSTEASNLLEDISRERARRASNPTQAAKAPAAASLWFQGYISADECRSRLAVTDWGAGVAAYVLWDRRTGEPVYCGTARNRSRIAGHLKKDDLRNAPVGLTARNPELRAYCLAQPRGWLGVAFRLFASDAEAKREEQAIIASFGIRREGGKLFNQGTSG